MPWQDLAPGALSASPPSTAPDANFFWAAATGYRDFLRPGEAVPKALPVIVELKEGRCVADLQGELSAGCLIAPGYLDGDASRLRHCTALLTEEYLAGMTRRGPDSVVERLELQLPVIPQRARPVSDFEAPTGEPPPRPLAGKVLIGVIDSGCAFAHPWLHDAPRRGTRVLSLWDQDDGPAFARAPYAAPRCTSFGYGREAHRGLLERLMQDHAGGGSVDEAACYEAAGCIDLRHRFNHGAAVLGLLSRPAATCTRDGPDILEVEANGAPLADDADIVFVQLPRDAAQDSSSASLPRRILDGLHYILGFASADTTRIVVNISDGTSRGSHDGESIIERAMVELVDRVPALHIVLPAGNTFEESRHAQFDTLPPGAWESITLRLPADCEAAAYVSIWLPQAARDVKIRLVAPGTAEDGADAVAAGQVKGWPAAGAPQCGVAFAPLQAERRTGILIAFAPTAVSDGHTPRARSGDWAIQLYSESGVSGAPIHLYVPRNQVNPNALPRGRQARFVDAAYDRQRHMRAGEDDAAAPLAKIRRRGSLNSLATVPSCERISVVGSVLRREWTPSLYSSDGPAAGPANPRAGPDVHAPADSYRALCGVRGAGGLGGVTLRVHGSSFAAPQISRHLAGGGSLGDIPPAGPRHRVDDPALTSAPAGAPQARGPRHGA
jgi:hypothetical protein